MTEMILDVVQVVLSAAAIVVVSLKLGPRKRARRREEIASMAVDYAEQVGKLAGPQEKLTHALQAAQRIDAADNGRRDFSDAELRIAIEAVVHRRKGA